MSLREKIEFPTNTPVIVRLDWDEGTLKRGRFGDEYMYVTDADQRIMFVKPEVHQLIQKRRQVWRRSLHHQTRTEGRRKEAYSVGSPKGRRRAGSRAQPTPSASRSAYASSPAHSPPPRRLQPWPAPRRRAGAIGRPVGEPAHGRVVAGCRCRAGG